MSEWREQTLDNVIELQRGHDLPATTRGEGRVPVIGSFGVTGYHDVAKYSGPGVAIGRSGASIGVATYCPSPYWPLNTCLFVKNFRGNDPRWVYYLLDSIDFSGFNSGSAQPSLNRNYLKGIPVTTPPIAEQRAIAGVLGALDDKIESNRRIWRLRQEIAVAYFNLCSSRSEAEIPMNDLYRVGLSGVWGEESPTDSSTIETTCLRGRDLEDFMTGSPCAPPARFITNRQLQARNPELGEIWTAGSGSLGPSLLITESVKKRWGAPITNSNFVKRLVPIGQHIHHVPAFHVVWESWKSEGFSNFRTGTAMPNLDPEALLRGLSVPQLTIEEIAALTDLTEVALDSQLPKETMALSSLRDALLPELLSGRLRVRDAEKAVEGAL